MTVLGLKKFLLMTALVLGMAAPAPVSAATDPFSKVDCSKATDSTVCQTRGNNEDPITGPNGVVTKATDVIAVIAGIAAVIFLVLGGLKYVTSGGAPDQISRAKESIIYALVGLVLIILARAIIGFVLTKF